MALLPGLDPTTMGGSSDDWYVTDDVAVLVFDRNGNAGPTIWVDGVVGRGRNVPTDDRDLADTPISQIHERLLHDEIDDSPELGG